MSEELSRGKFRNLITDEVDHLGHASPTGGEKLSAGAELKTTTGSYFRLVFRGPQTLLSVGASKKF